MKHVDGLTGVRALAALAVTFFHLFGMVGPAIIAIHAFGLEIRLHPLASVGWVGANIFFVLSGYLLVARMIGRLHEETAARATRHYLVARIRRVLPAYWAQIGVLMAVSLWANGAPPDWARSVPLNLVMAHGLLKDTSWAINPVYWTLPIEFAFYLCVPFIGRLLFAAEKRGGNGKWRVLLALVLGSLAGSWIFRYAVFLAYEPRGIEWLVWSMNQLPGTIDQFMIGGAAGVCVRWKSAQLRQLAASTRSAASTLLFVVGMGGIVVMMYFVDSLYTVYWNGHWALFVWYSITACFIALLLLSITLSSPLARMAFSNPVAVYLGTISYSLYLWHYPIGLWIMKSVDMSGMSLARFSCYVLPPLVIASSISYWLVEKPFMDRTSRLARDPSAARAPAPEDGMLEAR